MAMAMALLAFDWMAMSSKLANKSAVRERFTFIFIQLMLLLLLLLLQLQHLVIEFEVHDLRRVRRKGSGNSECSAEVDSRNGKGERKWMNLCSALLFILCRVKRRGMQIGSR